VPPNSEPDERTPVLPVPDTEPEREGGVVPDDTSANRPPEPASASAGAPATDAKAPRKAPARRKPATPGATASSPSSPSSSAAETPEAAPSKPVRSTARAPRTPAAPRATSGTRAPARTKTTPSAPDAAKTTAPPTPSVADPGEETQNEKTAAARVAVTRTPAARKTPAKPSVSKAPASKASAAKPATAKPDTAKPATAKPADTKPAATKPTRLASTTTSTADTAAAIEAAAVVDGVAVDETASAQSAATGAETAQPKTAAARSGAARSASAKAAAEKAAAAKTESAAKAGAARAAATKSAAAKAATARSAATASARAATSAASAAAAARAAAATPEEADVVVPPVGPETGTNAPIQEDVEEEAAMATNQVEPDPVVPPDDEKTALLPVASDVADDETQVLATSVPDVDAPAPLVRRPFWRLPRTFTKKDPAVSTDRDVPEVPAAEASAEPGLKAETPVVRPGAPTGLTGLLGASVAPKSGRTVPAPRVPSVIRKPVAPRTGPAAIIGGIAPVEIAVTGLNKRFGQNVAVAGVDLEVRAGSFYGIVGPNGAGKTTTLSMITGLLRPDSGSIHVHGIDVWADPIAAKRTIGVLPDRLRLFDRLTGAQLLYYSGVLRGLESETVRTRSADLAKAFGLEDALNRLVADYSAGMSKKIALACAMIHSPRVLVLDEPFESVDPVSAVNVTEILQRYVASGGTVILSSHGMDLIQRVCDHVAIIVRGSVLAAGTIDEVRGNVSLEERFVDLAGGRKVSEGLEWLHNFSD